MTGPLDTSDTAALAAIRFGFGLSPGLRGIAPEALLAGLAGPDRAAANYPVIGFDDAMALTRDFRAARRASGQGNKRAEAARKALRSRIGQAALANLCAAIARGLDGADPFRERLALFWADHFTAAARSADMAHAASAFVDATIRPHLAGRFADMAVAAVLHPFMLVYLDQNVSVGPGSVLGLRTGKGLNENLAREVLELHTLGAGGAYTQRDVREFAELLTGLGFNPAAGAQFLPNRAEPGAETVLGRSYGGPGRARRADIVAALHDIARHPDTQAHLARKLAAHFVADVPPPGLVARLTQVWRDTDGWLPAVYAALVTDPDALTPPLAKVKPPFDFTVSALLALGVGAEAVAGWPARTLRRAMLQPLSAMGQPFQSPGGPDGWPDTAQGWIAADTLTARIDWAIAAPRALAAGLPDPRDLVETALGPFADAGVRFAAQAAETRGEGVGLVLASAAFNRR